ncbi:brain-enriched guanylate kinase-associated protein isoform X4 [Anolis sagrei]|uniref:brain-enriched guanylate kinase-associated protein isoform X4 n=1 Tax=Anolis sagrei TaxID=38937 RepID=UPI0035221F57
MKPKGGVWLSVLTGPAPPPPHPPPSAGGRSRSHPPARVKRGFLVAMSVGCKQESKKKKKASAAEMEKIRVRNSWVPACLWQPRILQGRLTKSSPNLWDSTLQEQKGELRKRLSYTTHKLEMLETEFDSTRQYLEVELRRAQEELEKVTEKLRRIQNNYLALQRINQDLEDKLYRMGQHYEEEKRALSHEIIALNNHLIEAKVTIDKLSEDNELYRKDCNLAAHLLQCSKNYDRAHKLSEEPLATRSSSSELPPPLSSSLLPSEFQERVSIHLEKHGCSLSVPLCHTSFADNIPTCVIAKVLEKPDPNSLSSHLSGSSTRDLAFQDSSGKLSQRPQYKSDIYCSDTALYCPDERRRERRQSVDMQVKDVGFLRSQNSTDSTVEEDGFHSSFSHEAFPEYVTSLPTSSSYSSFSVTSEEKENAQASTLTASQQAIYLSSRDEMFERKPSPGYDHQGSPRFAKSKSIQHMELADEENSPTFTRTMSPYASEPYHFSAITAQQALASQKMRSECRNTHLSEEDLPGRWRQLSVEDIGAYSYRNSGRLSPCSFSEQYYRSPIKKADSRSSPIYASYKGDSFSEGDDICQSRLVESCFLTTDSGLNIDISASCKQDKLSSYKTKELRDKKNERITVQVCSSKSIDGSPVLKREYVDVSPNSSAESLNQSSMEASEIHQSSIEQGSHSSLRSKQQQFQRTGSTGLSRKDSLTKAQLYGTLLN